MEDESSMGVKFLVGGAALILGAALFLTFYNPKKKSRRSKKPRGPVLLDPTQSEKRYSLPLMSKESISEDTRRFRFKLPSEQHALGLPVGNHVHLIATINGELVIRAYTPVSSDDDLGYVELVIKVYRPKLPQFPNGGKMSQYLDDMKVGDTIDFRGPSGTLVYKGNGKFLIKKTRKDYPVTVRISYLNMIAGGTGITPMLQLIREILKNPDDHVTISLLFANQTEQDILLRDELTRYEKEYHPRFRVWYTVDRAPENWSYSTGFINYKMIAQHLFRSADHTLTVMCGPRPMIVHACVPNLEQLGHQPHTVHAF